MFDFEPTHNLHHKELFTPKHLQRQVKPQFDQQMLLSGTGSNFHNYLNTEEKNWRGASGGAIFHGDVPGTSNMLPRPHHDLVVKRTLFSN